MADKRQQAKNARWKATLPTARPLSPESRSVTLMYPDLHLRVWCNALGLNIVAYVDRSDSKGKLHRTQIASATWRGPLPSEEDVVLWAARALSVWLEARILALGDAEAELY